MVPPTPRERILKTLAFQETDIVPYHLMIDDMVRPRLAAYFCDDGFERILNNHLPFYELEPQVCWSEGELYMDVFGCVWRKVSFPHLERVPLTAPSLSGYTFPDLKDKSYFTGIEDFFATYNQHFTMCGFGHGYFDRGWSLRGMENFLGDFITNPKFVEEFFHVMTDIYLDLIDHIAVYPFDGIRFADDWGYQRGSLIGADRWRKFVKPGLKKIFEHARSRGLLVMVHSDGDITQLIPDLIEIGVSILNPLQPEAMDVLEIKRRYGRDLCFNGGISTQITLPRGTVQDVCREVAACLRYLGKGGGYVIAPAKAILPDVPLENAAALIDSLVNQPVKPDDPQTPLPGRVEELWRVYSEFHPHPVSSTPRH